MTWSSDDDADDQYGDYDDDGDDNDNDKVFVRSKITWRECLAHWQSAQSLSKAASRLRPFLWILMLLVVSFLLHLAIPTMGNIFIKSVVFLGLLGEGGGLKTPTLGWFGAHIKLNLLLQELVELSCCNNDVRGCVFRCEWRHHCTDMLPIRCIVI